MSQKMIDLQVQYLKVQEESSQEISILHGKITELLKGRRGIAGQKG